MHQYLLKELAHEVAPALTKLFNLSLETGTVQVDWRCAAVSPYLREVGSKKSADNYRPISRTSIVCKSFESLVRENIMLYLLENDLLSSMQFGFLWNRSTIIQLLPYLDYCAEAMGKSQSVDPMCLDFQKAFDTAPQRRLMDILKAYVCSDIHFNPTSFSISESLYTSRFKSVNFITNIDICVNS